MCGLLRFVGMMSHWSEKKRINVLLWRTEVGTSLETEGMREFALLSISTGCLEVNTTGFSPELGYGVNPARLWAPSAPSPTMPDNSKAARKVNASGLLCWDSDTDGHTERRGRCCISPAVECASLCSKPHWASPQGRSPGAALTQHFGASMPWTEPRTEARQDKKSKSRFSLKAFNSYTLGSQKPPRGATPKMGSHGFFT